MDLHLHASGQGFAASADKRFAWGIAVAAVLTWAVAFSLNRAEADLWGHVQYGRDVLATGKIPATTTYSFTAVGYPWINHENLSEVLFALIVDNCGIWALSTLRCLLGIALLSGIFWHARQQGVAPLTSGAALLLAAATLASFWQIRPQLLSYAFFTLLILLLSISFDGWQGEWHLPWARRLARADQTVPQLSAGRLKLLWLAPLLLVFWANAHGGFLAGLCIYVAYLLLRGLEIYLTQGRRSFPILAHLGMMIAAGILVIFLNPYGPRLLVWLRQDLSIPRPEITEWNPLTLASEPFWPFAILLVAAGVGIVASRKPLDATHLALFALTFWQALAHQRHIPFCVLLVACWVPRHWQSAWDRFCAGRRTTADSRFSPLARQALWAGIVVTNVALSFVLVYRLASVRVERERYPVSALQFMADHRLSGRLVVTYNWAQYALAALAVPAPGRAATSVAFDGRFRTCFPPEFGDEHFDFILGTGTGVRRCRATSSDPDPTRVLHRGNPDLVLISRFQPHAVEVMQDQDDWVLLYQDQLAQLWGCRCKYDDQSKPTYLPASLRHLSDDPQLGSVAWPALPQDTAASTQQARTST
jgi:hypothetical protein